MKRVDTTTWKKFTIGDIFSIERGRRHKAQDRIDGDFPFYSASSENNGIIQYISNPISFYSNAIVVTIFCDAFYAKGEFSASDDTTILKNSNMSELAANFVCVSIKANKTKYDFKHKAFSGSIEKDTIKLPARKNSQGEFEPDWKYMEDYMKNIEKQAINRVSSLSIRKHQNIE